MGALGGGQVMLRREVISDASLIGPIRDQVRLTLPWYRRLFFW
jgi:hypothetical protein